MKRVIVSWIWLAAVMPSLAGTVPNQITYQGTIKEKGVLVTGTRTMLFRITDSVGTNPGYWSSGPIDIAVYQGLFSTVLSPTGVDWQNVIPYIELSVGPQGQTPQIMLPREPITATTYSLISGSIIDGAVSQGSVAPGLGLVPSGTLLAFAGTNVPLGWLLCNGASVSRSTYPNLFTAIGTTWGSLDGGSFNLPDMRGRTAIGAGQGTGLTNRNVADTFGEEAHVLTVAEMPSHTHGVTDPGHNHSQNAHSHSYNDPSGGGSSWGGSSSGYHSGQTGLTTATNNPATTGITLQNSGGGQAHNNMPPSAVVNYIIKT